MLQFEPIAAKLRRVVDVAAATSPHPIDDARQRLLRDEAESESEGMLTAELSVFMANYLVVLGRAMDLLKLSPFAGLAQRYAEAEQEYMPGGPPMSPIYDSFLSQHVLTEMPQGAAGETPVSVLSALLRGRSDREDVAGLAHSIARAHLDLYKATEVEGQEATLVHCRSQKPLVVHLSGPFLRQGDLFLGRVLEFREESYIADSPYLLEAPERAWLDYFERVRKRAAPASNAKKPTRGKGKKKRSKRSGWDALEHHLKYGGDWRFWLEFFMDAYAGERRGIVRLASVPDRPEEQPHSKHYAGASGGQASEAELGVAPPLDQLRRQLLRIAEREGVFERELSALEQRKAEFGIEGPVVGPQHQTLFFAYCILGARDARGETVLERYAAKEEPSPELNRAIEDTKRGWFSVFEIKTVRLDESIDLLDRLRNKRLTVQERLATRQVKVGDWLGGWVIDDGAGRLTLEGGVFHMPAGVGARVSEILKEASKAAARRSKGLGWRERASSLPPLLILASQAVRQNLPAPRLTNTSGHELVWSTARYRVLNHAGVSRALAAAFEDDGSGEYRCVDENHTLIARLELKGDTLLVETNSQERLRSMKDRLESLLGQQLRASLDSVVGEKALDEMQRDARKRDRPPEPLPPDLAQQVAEHVLQQIRSQLDQPIDMFGGKTLRQLAKSKNRRHDAINWLREQERILRHNPQFRVDMRPLWQDLRLEYQGLDTDDPVLRG